MNPILFFIFLALLISCSSPEEIYEVPENAPELIAGDSSKTWKIAKKMNNKTRMNMGDCFLSYQVTYKRDQTMHDNTGENAGCGPTLQGNWQLVKSKTGHTYLKVTSNQIPELLNIENDYYYLRIIELSKSKLVTEYHHNQTTSQKTLITDYLVPSDSFVPNRDFHR